MNESLGQALGANSSQIGMTVGGILSSLLGGSSSGMSATALPASGVNTTSDWMPIVIIGGVLLVVIMLFKK